MTLSTEAKRAQFRRLHEAGCFVIPNPWDIGSARALQSMGFKALASTSSGFAWTIGKADNHITLEDALTHLTALSAATDLPVNADFEGGFAHEPEAVARNVTRAVATGISGLSIENTTGDAAKPLYDDVLAVERIRAARAAIDSTKSGVVLVARDESFLIGHTDLSKTIDRLHAFAEAGADCLYAPAITDRALVSALVGALAPKPVNVLMPKPGLSVAELADLGVRRISVGGALARAAWGGFLKAAREIAEKGSFAELGHAASGAELNKLFSEGAKAR